MKQIIACLLCCSALALANPPEGPHYQNTNTVVFATGFVSGVGFKWRHWFETHGFQLTLLPYIDMQKNDNSLFVDVGTNYLHALWPSRTYLLWGYPSRNLVYSYTGFHALLTREKQTMEGYYEENDYYVAFGSGVGVQMNVGSVQINMGLGFMGNIDDIYRRDSSAFSYDYEYITNRTDYALHPSIDCSLGYTFGGK